jgi:hypothetical protein
MLENKALYYSGKIIGWKCRKRNFW